MASTSEKKIEEQIVNEPPAKKMKETSQEPEWLQYFNKDKVVINKYQQRQARILKKQDEDIMSDPDYQVILTKIYKSNYIRSKEVNTLLQIQENFLDKGVLNKEALAVIGNEEEEIVEEEEDPMMKELQEKINDLKDKAKSNKRERRRKVAAVEQLEKTPGVGVPGVSYKKKKSTKERAANRMKLELEFFQQYVDAQEAEKAKIDAHLEVLNTIEKLNKEAEEEKLKLLLD